MRRVADDTLALYRGGHDGIAYVLDFPPELPRVLARSGELKEVLLNVLENARAALDGGGQVRIAAAPAGGSATASAPAGAGGATTPADSTHANASPVPTSTGRMTDPEIVSLTQAADEGEIMTSKVALTKATDIIAAEPDVAAFFAANDDMGLGIVKAVENAGRTGQIQVVSVDGNQDALESVQAGGLTATVAQYPFAIGQLGLQACEVASSGGTLPADVESPTALVTTDKAADAIAAFPQPFEEFDNPLTSLLPAK